MKKIQKFVVLFFVLATSLTLQGCIFDSDNNQTNNIEGYYYIESITLEGISTQEYNQEKIMHFDESKNFFEYELNNSQWDEKNSGTFDYNDQEITLNYNDSDTEQSTYSLENNTLTLISEQTLEDNTFDATYVLTLIIDNNPLIN